MLNSIALPGTMRTAFLRGWLLSVTAGELAGFCVPAVTAALVFSRSHGLALPALVAAGSVEGAVLGWSQARILSRHIDGFHSRRWVRATAAAAAFAWLVGMTPSTSYPLWSHWPTAIALAVAAVGAALLLCSIGIAQWVELRHRLGHASYWIGATALAWCAGLLAFTMVTSPLWQEGQEPWLIAVIAVLGGFVMAATMAVITCLAVLRLLRDGACSGN